MREIGVPSPHHFSTHSSLSLLPLALLLSIAVTLARPPTALAPIAALPLHHHSLPLQSECLCSEVARDLSHRSCLHRCPCSYSAPKSLPALASRETTHEASASASNSPRAPAASSVTSESSIDACLHFSGLGRVHLGALQL